MTLSQIKEKVGIMVIIDMKVLMGEFANLVNSGYIHVFVWFVGADIATGILKGLLNKQGDSTKGLLGVVKHLLVVMLVLAAVPYLRMFGFGSLADAFVLFYIAVYGISFTENWGQLGLPLPSFVKDRLIKLKGDSEKKGSDELAKKEGSETVNPYLNSGKDDK